MLDGAAAVHGARTISTCCSWCATRASIGSTSTAANLPPDAGPHRAARAEEGPAERYQTAARSSATSWPSTSTRRASAWAPPDLRAFMGDLFRPRRPEALERLQREGGARGAGRRGGGPRAAPRSPPQHRVVATSARRPPPGAVGPRAERRRAALTRARPTPLTTPAVILAAEASAVDRRRGARQRAARSRSRWSTSTNGRVSRRQSSGDSGWTPVSSARRRATSPVGQRAGPRAPAARLGHAQRRGPLRLGRALAAARQRGRRRRHLADAAVRRPGRRRRDRAAALRGRGPGQGDLPGQGRAPSRSTRACRASASASTWSRAASSAAPIWSSRWHAAALPASWATRWWRWV